MSRNEERSKTEGAEQKIKQQLNKILFIYFICKLWRLNQLSYIIINTQKKQQKCIENEREWTNEANNNNKNEKKIRFERNLLTK